MIKSKYSNQAINIVTWYREGSDLTEGQEHLLYDCASEHGQILDNVVHTAWFLKALAENIQALGGDQDQK